MSKITFYTCVLTVLLGSLALPAIKPALAGNLDVTSVEISDFKDNTAKITWLTPNTPTKGVVYYGQDPEKLDHTAAYSALSMWHETSLTDLEAKKQYFYSLTIYDQWGARQETFLRSFSTKDMRDTIAPRFLEFSLLQTTPNAAAITWRLSEKASVYIYYAKILPDISDNDLKYRYAGSVSATTAQKFIYGLEPDSAYWLKLVAKDSGGNSTEQWARFYTSTGDKKFKVLVKAYNVQPLSPDPARITPTSATISWQTNWVATTKISYGTSSGRYTSSKVINPDDLATTHQITLSGLTANTTYYYKIAAYNSFYGGTQYSEEYTFRTASKVTYQATTAIPTQAYNADTDRDGLTDGYELSIGTDIYNYDSDGDGMMDGAEVKGGYDPTVKNARLNPLYYSQPRFLSTIENQKATDLKTIVTKNFGKINFRPADWQVLVRAYTYGGYPIEAILRAIEVGGKTVHPTFPWSLWQTSSDYQNYMKI